MAVWVPAAGDRAGLFYWWYHTVDKTRPVFIVLVYVVACTVAGVMLAMAQGRPLISALSIAVMSGPFASVAAAAPLYGYYYCERTGHCLLSVSPVLDVRSVLAARERDGLLALPRATP